MLDIVFGDSACGSLKAAQHYGEGEFRSGVSYIGFGFSGGEKPTSEEIEKFRREFEEKKKAEWESAVPMGGNAWDVFGLDFILSVGDISENEPGVLRQRAMEWLWSIYPENMGQDATNELMKVAAEALKTVCGRVSVGEPLRIWYSNQPDEMCGLHWFMAQLVRREIPCENICVVKLPEWEIGGNGEVVRHSGWGGVSPADWHRYPALQEKVTPELCKSMAGRWQQLQRENAPLRAVLNGQLLSVSETIYDDFILREIEAENEVFHEAMIIGRVLGKYNLGIGDAWVALRMEKMICDGFLEPVTEAPKDSPIYHRELRKCIEG